MKRIKNDSRKYLKRSDLGPKQDRSNVARLPVDKGREEDYLIAPIDSFDYIDFRGLIKRKSSDLKNSIIEA